ncbi:MAG: hypothetical protein L6264_11745 [Weeksellaceae bacterium]|nr:hypothetical protein [Bacteroidota bacterium]MCG2781611.1 hypothetical protein [Weeksellaceae bacterium]
MKKIAILMVMFFTTYSFGQKASKDYTFFEKSASNNPAPEETTPAEPGDPAPIDDYIPALFLAGAAMAVYYARKKQKVTS